MSADIVNAVIMALKVRSDIQRVVGTRVYRGAVPPQSSVPALVVSLVSRTRRNVVSDRDYIHVRVQVTVVAPTDEKRVSLDDLVVQILNRNHHYLSTFGARVFGCTDAGGRFDGAGPTATIFVSHRDFEIDYL